jgi:PAS domain S-box-containing protein
MDNNRHLSWVQVDLTSDRQLLLVRGPDGVPRLQDRQGPSTEVFAIPLSFAGSGPAQDLGELAIAIDDDAIRASLQVRLIEFLVLIVVLDGVLVALVVVLLQRVLLKRLESITASLPSQSGFEPERDGDELEFLMDRTESLITGLGAVLDSIQDAVLTTDLDLRIDRVNPAAEQILGQPAHYLLGKALTEAVPIPMDDGVLSEQALREAVLAQGEIISTRQPVALERGGQAAPLVNATFGPVRRGDGPISGIILVMSDMTKRVEVEEQLRHSQKMEAIGQLSGGIAHDFNNMLGAVIGACEVLQIRGADEKQRARYVSLIQQTAERAAELNQKLLTFSRKDQVRRELIDLGKVTDEAIQLLRHSVDPRISIQWQQVSEPYVIRGDSNALVNCLLNIGLNARDAMPDGGAFAVSIERVRLSDGEVLDLGLEPAPAFVKIGLKDSGSGIPAHIRNRIFDPFVTTKPLGKGTGLGLAAVYGTINALGGHIAVDSEVGHGTTFVIHLPMAEMSAEDNDESGAQMPVHMGGGIAVVVDDDAHIREVVSAHVEDLGYEAICVENGALAVERFRDHADRIKIVLMDVMMPVMGGVDALQRIRNLDKDVPIMLMTGQGDERELNEKGVGLIVKPFRRKQLVRSLLTLMAPA